MIQERIVTLRVHCGVKTCNMLDGSGRQCMYIEPISKRAAHAHTRGAVAAGEGRNARDVQVQGRTERLAKLVRPLGRAVAG